MTIDDEITSEIEESGEDMQPVTETPAPAESLSPHAITVDKDKLRKILEGALLAAGQPLTVARLIELFDEKFAPEKEEVLVALQEIEFACAERGFELKEVASGWRFQVRKGLAPWVNRLWEEKPQKYSRALLETLSLIAYRQPITRGDIEEIRGVAVSSHIMKTLMEREWVKVVGHRDVPGRPSLYATTRQFLDYFNLKSLEDLPSLSEIRDLDEINPVLNLGGDEEGLGEPDTDAAVEENESSINSLVKSSADTAVADLHGVATEETEEILEEFVEGEDAFEDVEYIPINTAQQTREVIADAEGSASANDVNEDEEFRNH